MLDGPAIYQTVNFILAAALYTVLGRYVLSLFFRPDSQLVIWRVFAQITDPFLKAARYVTPQVVPDGLVMVLAVVWLILLRMLWLLLAAMYGFLPRVGP